MIRISHLALWAMTVVSTAQAADPRDIVFECPCRAEWAANAPGGTGELTLTFGVRSFRATDSGEIWFTEANEWYLIGSEVETPAVSIGRVAAGTVMTGRRLSMEFDRPAPDTVIEVAMVERAGQAPTDIDTVHQSWRLKEYLSLWPTQEFREEDAVRIEFVDILSDTDGDGVGDVNENLSATSPFDAASRPSGVSTVDVLALYNDGFRRWSGGYPQTRIQHVMAVTNALFADSATNVRIRTVGMSEIALIDGRYPSYQDRRALEELHGADLSLRFDWRGRHSGCPLPAGGCAILGGSRRRGYWNGDTWAAIGAEASATFAAHELGHSLGLAHSVRQGEAQGAFRWSRGHYVDSSWGTIMSYGRKILRGVFSNPAVDCDGVPCGVAGNKADGANAVRSLDLVRYQVAAHRPSKGDSDGDGVVDPADALPDDPDEHLDTDGDGVGDNADDDDDNDGVADADDAFPLDPGEWADADGDGLGDNADDEVLELDPFQDAALRGVVESALGKEPGAEISAEDLATLTVLRAARMGIRDLTGLELAENLEHLYVQNNEIGSLSPLTGLKRLNDLFAAGNAITDLTPLEQMHGLAHLSVSNNPVVDISPLVQLGQLRELAIGGNRHRIQQPELIGELTGLEELHASELGVTDLSFLSGLSALRELDISDNPVSDLSPLGELPLTRVDASGTMVSDLSPLDGHALRSLDISDTRVSLDQLAQMAFTRELGSLAANDLRVADISALAELPRLGSLSLARNRISDLSPLRDLAHLSSLYLYDNRVSDLVPLASLSNLRFLTLRFNHIANVGPIVRREAWNLAPGAGSPPRLDLYGNPLSEESLREHIPALESWGITVERNERPVVDIPDERLRALVAQATAGSDVLTDSPVTRESIQRLWRLDAFNAGVSELTGLQAATRVSLLFLRSNHVADLSPLADLTNLRGLDLGDNQISDLSPLVAGAALDTIDWVALDGNPLSEESLNTHVPALRDAGWRVKADSVNWIVVADGAKSTFQTAGYFESMLGSGLRFEAEADPTGPVSVEMEDGTLAVSPGTTPGALSVTVTATDTDGETASLDFDVALALPNPVPLLPSGANAVRHGFVRVVNRTTDAGAVRIEAVDDDGRHAGPLMLAMQPEAVVHFNSADLENGNRAKRLTGLAGVGEGDWRLRLASALDIEVLSYVRTADGFLTSMHDVAPEDDGVHRVAIFNPASNDEQVSLLRLVNPGPADADVTITGVDGEGVSAAGAVNATVPAGASRTFSAADLESGDGMDGALGDGDGKWTLTVSANRKMNVMSLLESPGGHLTNLSTIPAPEGGVHAVPLFPSASDRLGRQGFVRVINRSDTNALVSIAAYDHTQREYEPLTLAVGANGTVHFNSDDLELGNPDKGLSGSTGAGDGDWRLELTSASYIEVLAYVRTPEGFLTSMHDVVAGADNRYDVPIFNPGRNTVQVSRLRLINKGTETAEVTITGIDDAGEASPPVETSVHAESVATYTAAELESGVEGLEGALGMGSGKWRLTVESERPVTVMSLLESPTGHLTNLSTVPSTAHLSEVDSTR